MKDLRNNLYKAWLTDDPFTIYNKNSIAVQENLVPDLVKSATDAYLNKDERDVENHREHLSLLKKFPSKDYRKWFAYENLTLS